MDEQARGVHRPELRTEAAQREVWINYQPNRTGFSTLILTLGRKPGISAADGYLKQMNSPGLTHPRKPGFLRRLRVQLFRSGPWLILIYSSGVDGAVAIEPIAEGSSRGQTG